MAGQEIIKFSLTNRKYGEFSNFYQCDIIFEGSTFKNSEAIYQSFKTLDMDGRNLSIMMVLQPKRWAERLK